MEQKNRILLFEDFTKLYKRWDGGELRKEDEFRSNIDDFKPVDLGKDFHVLFADVDLIVNGNDKFTWEEVESMIPKIEKTGWRLPTHAEIQKMFYKYTQPPTPKDNVVVCWEPKKYAVIHSKENGKMLFFPTDEEYCESYWLNKELPDDSKTERGFGIGDGGSYYGCIIRTNNFEKTEECKVRLVKDK